MPSVWVEGPLESAQAFWLSLESQEAVLSSVAKQMDRVHWGGNITVKLLCKKKKLALFIWNVWSLLGYSYLLVEGKLKTVAHVSYL